MQGFRALTIFLLSIALAVGSLSVTLAGDGPTLQGRWHEGRITSITVDRCGVEPGQCIGSIVLAEQSIGEVELGIRPGTWIKHGERFISIEDLRVGNYVRVQTVHIHGDRLPQVTELVVEPYITRVRRLLLPCPSAWQMEDTPCS